MVKTLRKISCIFGIICVWIGLLNTDGAAGTQLKTTGSVVGYNLAAQQASGSFLFAASDLLVKIVKISRGGEKARFIRVRFRGVNENYTVAHFNLGKTLEFQLFRDAECDETFGELITFHVRDQHGEIVETHRSMSFVSGLASDLLPSDAIVPCYLIR
jgi:hypothetical protein